MVELSDDQFEALINDVMSEFSPDHVRAVQNVAIVYADEPTAAQREELALRHDQDLLGLYEGVPLSERNGVLERMPDKITIFKNIALASSPDYKELRAQIKNTLWHELAHYFGLNHQEIYELEKTRRTE